MDSYEFRKKLDEVTEGLPGKHVKGIENLKADHSHNIRIYDNPNFVDNVDCFLFVFRDSIPSDLLNAFEDLAEDNKGQSEDIVNDLVLKGFISLHDDRRESDAIVVYFAGALAKHFGKIEDNRIVSKWGGVGHAWKHGPFEVPLSYGETVKFSNGQIDEHVLRKVLETYSRGRRQ